MADVNTMATRARGPIHESLVDLIKFWAISAGELALITRLVEITIIPAGHDALIAAIETTWGGRPGCEKAVLVMKAAISAEKTRVEEKARQEAEADATARGDAMCDV